MHNKLRSLLLATTILMPTTALAQVTPARVGISNNLPQILQVLDNTNTWVSIGQVDPGEHVWIGVGTTYDVDQYPTVKGDFINDDGPAIVAAIAAATLKGGTVTLRAHPYWNQTQTIIVPANVRLMCAGGFTKFNAAYDHTQMPCTIYQKAGTSLIYYGEIKDVGVEQDRVHFLPKTTRAEIEAFIAGFVGNGIVNGPADATEGGSQAVLQNVMVGGFDKCILVNGAYQLQMRQILGDCTNGLDIQNSHDNNSLYDIEFWQFLVSHKSVGAQNWNISNIADNGSGIWRVTTSAANDITTGEKIWIAPNGAGGAGAGGQWTVTRIDANNFDLPGSASTVSLTGNTLIGQTYIDNLSSVSNLQPGMTVSGAGIPAGATIAAVWRTRNAISLDQDHEATATATGITLSFASPAYSGTPGRAFYDGVWRSGIGFNIGRADGTKCTHCFAFGFANGFNFTDSVGVSFDEADIDELAFQGNSATPHLCNQNVAPVGIKIAGVSFDSKISGRVLTNDCVNVMNVGTNTNPGFTVSGFRPGSSAGIGTKVENTGVLQLNVTGMQDLGAGSILLNNSSQPPVFMANVLAGVRLFSTGLTPIWVGDGNIFGGRLDQQVPLATRAQTLWAVNNGSAAIYWYDNSQSLDNKLWRALNGNAQWCISTENDAQNAVANGICISRLGNAVTSINFGAPMAPKPYSVATLPTCSPTVNKGTGVQVFDALVAPTYWGTPVGGGTINAPVWCDGIIWRYH